MTVGEDVDRGPGERAEAKKELKIRAQIFHKQNHMLYSNSGIFILLETIFCISST